MNNNKRRRANNASGTAKRLFLYVAGAYKLRLALVFLCIIISSVAGVASALFLQVLIDDYITPLLKVATPDFAPMLRAILIMGAILGMGVLATYLYNFLMVTICQGILKKIRDQMFNHMQTLPVRYFDKHAHGDIMSRYTNDTDSLRQMISQAVPQVFSSLVTLISVLVSMLYVSLYLTLFVLVFMVLMLFVTGKIGGKSGGYFVKQQASLGKLNGYVEEMMEGQKVVKVFGHEQATMKDFRAINEELCHSATRANTFANILMPIMANLGSLQYVLIAVLGGALAINGVAGLTIGGIAAFLQLSRSFTMPLAQIAQQYNFIVMALAGAERIFELMDEASETDEGHVTLVNVQQDAQGDLIETPNRTGIWAWKHMRSGEKPSYTQLRGDVRFENASFGYNEGQRVLKHIALYAEPGQKVAFVGATGAGKTTITNLINRFYDIDEGSILYDGIPIKDIKKADLRSSLGIVLQDTHLFTGTIMENIRYGRLDATDKEVMEAAKLAHADSFITIMPQGYQTVLSGDGAELSQGQRQLLSIARAALANPPVLILDEATSNIDTRTETIIQRGMDALMEGRTVFVIAHRLSTIQNSDVIMVLDQGKIIERGDHARLIAQEGKYYQLYTGSFETA